MTARDVTNRGGVRGGFPPRHSHVPRHLQKPERSSFHSFGGFLLKPGSPYVLSPVSLSRSHVHTSGTKPAICLLGFYVVSCNSSRPRQKYYPAHSLIRQKSFLEKTKKGGWARDVTTEGGPGGHPPQHSHVPPSPPKARAKLFSSFGMKTKN